MNHLGLQSAAILGTSRGGLIAMGLAATVPDRIIGAALNDIGPEIDPNVVIVQSFMRSESLSSSL